MPAIVSKTYYEFKGIVYFQKSLETNLDYSDNLSIKKKKLQRYT